MEGEKLGHVSKKGGKYVLDLRPYDDFLLGVHVRQYLRRFRSGDKVELIFNDLSLEEGVILAMDRWGYEILAREKKGKDVHLEVKKA